MVMTVGMIIETERLILRPFLESDAADAYKYLTEPMVNCFSCMKQLMLFFDYLFREKGHGVFTHIRRITIFQVSDYAKSLVCAEKACF